MSNTGNKIRKIFIGAELNNQMTYTVGANHTFKIEKETVTRKINNILETEDGFLIYLLGNDNEIQLWKKLPKNNLTTVEYNID